MARPGWLRLTEKASGGPPSPAGRSLVPSGWVPPGKLLRSVEGLAYWTAAAPVLARVPAALAYRVAC